MSRKLANAIALYLEGIRDGNIREALDKYTGERYTQHSTGVADGKEGFLAFFEPFLERNPTRDIRIVRGFADGQYVFLHAFQSLNDGEAKWVTMDLFDTDDADRMIEHWDVISPFVEETVSGHTQIDGPTTITDLEHTERNKRIVRDFLPEVMQSGKFDQITKYVSSETYIQHNPQVGDGLHALEAFVTQLAERGQTITFGKVYFVVGQGNFVASYSQLSLGGEPSAVFDLFRLAGGLIVEHWDTMEPVPSPEAAKNSGKF